MKHRSSLLFAASLPFVAVSALAQSADTGFDPNADGEVIGMAMQPDGKVLVAGTFAHIGGQARSGLARLNADGSLDASFAAKVSDNVNSMAVQPDGKIVIGGTFTQAGGKTRNYIARFNADGGLDASFNPNAFNTVKTVALQQDGKVLIGGTFTHIGGVGGQERSHIARVNADGSLDTGFNPKPSDWVNVIAIQSDGKALVGGDFDQIDGQTRNHLGRLNTDGSLDTSFNPDADDSVDNVVVQPDGKVLVAGRFARIGGQARSHLARLNSDGSLDAGFDPNANDTVATLAVQPDGKVLIGGNFTQVDGMASGHLARLNTDGSLDTSFNPDFDDAVLGLSLQPDGEVLAGGSFVHVDGQARNRIARLRVADGSTQSLGVGADRASVQWLRSGSGPEFPFVWFEQSVDGIQWTTLGQAARIAGGWSLGGLTLPRNKNFRLRGRGEASNGNSTSLIESVRETYLTAYTVSASIAGGLGTVAPATQVVDPGQSVVLTVTPQPGWHTTAVHGDTCVPAENDDGTWIVLNVAANCAVQATFAQSSTPTMTLASSRNPSTFGNSVVLTATVTPADGNPVPTGTVTFLDGGNVIGNCLNVLLDKGTAACTPFALSVGNHDLRANFKGDDNTAASSNTLVQIVNVPTTSTTLDISPNPAVAGQVVTLTASVDASAAAQSVAAQPAATGPRVSASSTAAVRRNRAFGAPCLEAVPDCAPAGTVTFYDGSAQIGSGTVDQHGTATLSLSSPAPGTHVLSAVFAGSGYAQSSAQATLVVTSAVSSTPVAAPAVSRTMLALLGTLLVCAGLTAARLRP